MIRHSLFFLSMLILMACEGDFDFFNAKQEQNIHVGDDFILSNQSLLTNARKQLYLHNLAQTDSFLSMIDTVKLGTNELHHYKLTKGFLQYKNGEYDAAMKNIQKAAVYFNDKGNQRELADLNLTWGFILEEANVPSEAAKSYFESYEFYKHDPESSQYYYLMLGLARTGLNKEKYFDIAEEYLRKYPTPRNKYLFNSAKANSTDNPKEKKRFYARNLALLNMQEDKMYKIGTLTNLALVYQIMNQTDSANHYLKQATNLIDKHKISAERLLYYYLISSYINTRTSSFIEAKSAVDSVIAYAGDKPGMLKEAYLRKYDYEFAKGAYKEASSSMLQQMKYAREENSMSQRNQLVLLTIRHDIQDKNMEVIQIRNFWLKIVLISLLLFIAVSLLFVDYRIKTRIKLIRLSSQAEKFERQLKLTTNRLRESLNYRRNQIEEEYSDQKNNIAMKQSGRAWLDFITIFEAAHPFFVTKLKRTYPQLSSTDIKYCVCIFAEKTNGQAAYLLDVTPDAVKKAKRKLKKLFDLNSTQDLTTHLKSLNNYYNIPG